MKPAFAMRRRVAIRDVDAWSVVWYGNYLAYCDEARAELLRNHGLSPGSFVERGVIAPVVDMQARYRAPARYDDDLEIRVYLEPPRGTRLCFRFEICLHSSQAILAEIRTDQVLVRTSGELLYLVPDDIRPVIDSILAAQA